jgi:hypothetical protein
VDPLKSAQGHNYIYLAQHLMFEERREKLEFKDERIAGRTKTSTSVQLTIMAPLSRLGNCAIFALLSTLVCGIPVMPIITPRNLSTSSPSTHAPPLSTVVSTSTIATDNVPAPSSPAIRLYSSAARDNLTAGADFKTSLTTSKVTTFTCREAAIVARARYERHCSGLLSVFLGHFKCLHGVPENCCTNEKGPVTYTCSMWWP